MTGRMASIGLVGALLIAGCGGPDDVHRRSARTRAAEAEPTSGDGWQALLGFGAGGGADEAEFYGDVDGMARSADLVLLVALDSILRVDAQRPGDGSAAETLPTTTAKLRVLPGSPDASADELVDLTVFGVALSDAQVRGTDDQALVFLRRRADTGALRLVSSEGVIANRGGRASVVREETYVDRLDPSVRAALGDGSGFTELVSRVRTMRTGAASP